jgi:hypothetical protein
MNLARAYHFHAPEARQPAHEKRQENLDKDRIENGGLHLRRSKEQLRGEEGKPEADSSRLQFN